MPESDGKYNPGWQKMDDVARSGRTTMTINQDDARGDYTIVDALERCFKSAEDLATVASGIEERLGFILAADMDSMEATPSGSLDENSARAPMIGRLNDLDRRLRIIRNRLALTAERIAI